jgi:hypothetical protein
VALQRAGYRLGLRVPLRDLPLPRLALLLPGLVPRVRCRHLGVLLRPRRLSLCLQSLGLCPGLLLIAYDVSDKPGHPSRLAALLPSHGTTPRSSISDPLNTLRDYRAGGNTPCSEFPHPVAPQATARALSTAGIRTVHENARRDGDPDHTAARCRAKVSDHAAPRCLLPGFVGLERLPPRGRRLPSLDLS